MALSFSNVSNAMVRSTVQSSTRCSEHSKTLRKVRQLRQRSARQRDHSELLALRQRIANLEAGPQYIVVPQENIVEVEKIVEVDKTSAILDLRSEVQRLKDENIVLMSKVAKDTGEVAIQVDGAELHEDAGESMDVGNPELLNENAGRELLTQHVLEMPPGASENVPDIRMQNLLNVVDEISDPIVEVECKAVQESFKIQVDTPDEEHPIFLDVDYNCCVRPVFIKHSVGTTMVESVGNWREFLQGDADGRWIEVLDWDLQTDAILEDLVEKYPDRFFSGWSDADLLRFWLEWPGFCADSWPNYWYNAFGRKVPWSLCNLWRQPIEREKFDGANSMLDVICDQRSLGVQAIDLGLFTAEQVEMKVEKLLQFTDQRMDARISEIEDRYEDTVTRLKSKNAVLEGLVKTLGGLT